MMTRPEASRSVAQELRHRLTDTASIASSDSSHYRPNNTNTMTNDGAAYYDDDEGVGGTPHVPNCKEAGEELNRRVDTCATSMAESLALWCCCCCSWMCGSHGPCGDRGRVRQFVTLQWCGCEDSFRQSTAVGVAAVIGIRPVLAVASATTLWALAHPDAPPEDNPGSDYVAQSLLPMQLRSVAPGLEGLFLARLLGMLAIGVIVLIMDGPVRREFIPVLADAHGFRMGRLLRPVAKRCTACVCQREQKASPTRARRDRTPLRPPMRSVIRAIGRQVVPWWS